MKPALSVLAAVVAAAALVALPRNAATDHPAGENSAGHVMLTEKDLEWKEAPNSLPPGALAAILEGDPAKEGPFTLRFKVPAGWRVPPHTHPAIEHVTVLSGNFRMGSGATFDEAGMKDLPAGSFASMDAGVKHFAMAKDACVIQVHGMGPWGITYVNPADDPRNKGK